MENKISNSQVTPWDVSDVVDYEKLLVEFGVKRIDDEDKAYLSSLAKKKGVKEHLFLKRNLFYAQMDLKKTIQDHRDGKPIFLYTGRSPGSGHMHLGHLIPFEFTKYLQDLFDCNLYIEIPDDEKFLFKKKITSISDVIEFMKEDLAHVSAIGFDPDKTFIFRTTEFIKQMYPLVLETAKRITFSQARNTFGFEGQSNIGQVFYPAIQIVPTFFQKGQCLIPCAIDQNPYFLLQRDFAKKMGYEKNATILSKFLPALNGPKGKMSASNEEQAILLTDSPKQIQKKINKHAFSGGGATLEEHREYGGNCEIDVSFQWLNILFIDSDNEIANLRKSYESGDLLSGELKKILIEKVQEKIQFHQIMREKAIEEDLLERYMYSGSLAKEMWNKDFMNN